MTKTAEQLDPNSCWNQAGDDEVLFILRATDPASPSAIAAWAQARVKLGKNTMDDFKIADAISIALRMSSQTTAAKS